jgi:DNA-binding GntR family transcriptional regulator
VADNLLDLTELPADKALRERRGRNMRAERGHGSRPEGVRTLADAAYLRLKREILLGTRQPGAPLRLEALKKQLEMGFSPLREALMRLHSERLVDGLGQRGFCVARATPEQFDDLMRSRVRIEALLLEDAIRCGGDDWEATILGNFHRLSKREHTDPRTGLISEDWDAAHRAFHFSLVMASESACLKDFWQTLFDQGQRYRQITVTRGSRLRDDRAEHQRLMDAIMRRDLPEALAASREHIENTQALVRRLMFDSARFPEGATDAAGLHDGR